MNNKAKLSIASVLSIAAVAAASMIAAPAISSSAGSNSYSVSFDSSCANEGINFTAYTGSGYALTLEGYNAVTVKPAADVMCEIGVAEGNRRSRLTITTEIQKINSVDVTYQILNTTGGLLELRSCDKADFTSYQKFDLNDGNTTMHKKTVDLTSLVSNRKYIRIESKNQVRISSITVNYICG